MKTYNASILHEIIRTGNVTRRGAVAAAIKTLQGLQELDAASLLIDWLNDPTNETERKIAAAGSLFFEHYIALRNDQDTERKALHANAAYYLMRSALVMRDNNSAYRSHDQEACGCVEMAHFWIVQHDQSEATAKMLTEAVSEIAA